MKKLNKMGFQVVTSIEDNKIDVTNFDQLKKLGYVDIVIHLAAKTGIEESKKFPRDYYNVNTNGTLNLLEFCKLKKVPKFIYLSSYVYGKPEYLPIDEKHPVNPHSPYNMSKYLGELICKTYSENEDLNVVVLRPFCLFGPNQNDDFFIGKIFKKIQEEKNIPVVNGSNKRDYLFVDDLVEAILKCMSYDCKFEVFNVGTGTSHSFFDIKNCLELLLQKTINFKEKNISPNDLVEIVADISKIKQEMDWKAHFDLKTGLRQILKNYSIFIDE